jgi:hypothetical protein
MKYWENFIKISKWSEKGNKAVTKLYAIQGSKESEDVKN